MTYKVDWDTNKSDIARMKQICLCAICREMMYESDHLADHKVFDFEGDLKYIELVHIACGKQDNERRKFIYWDVSDPKPFGDDTGEVLNVE